MWELINDADMLTDELEWALDNLQAVHTIMEEDSGANWQRRCNAVFSVYLQLCSIRERLAERLCQTGRELRLQRTATE